MTVSSATNKSGPYLGNGSTVAFDYEFRVLDETHLTVVMTEGGVDTTVSPSDYAVSGVGAPPGGAVTFSVAPATGQSITIIRNAPFTQPVDLENQGAYYAETVEDALDLAAMRDQQLAEGLSRAVQIPVGAGTGVLDGLIANIVRLGDSADEIDTVAGIAANVSTVAGISANVTTVAGIAPNVATVAGIAPDVTAVKNIAANVTTVAGIAADVSEVSSISAEVEAVAAVAAGVATVAAIDTEVATVAGLAADIPGIPANVTAAQLAETNAQKWATNPEDSVVSGGLYSALHYAAKAAESLASMIAGLAGLIHGASTKTTPVDADEFGLADSEWSWSLSKITWGNMKAGILAYFNSTSDAVPVDADRVWYGDSTDGFAPIYGTWTSVKAFLKTYFDTLYSVVGHTHTFASLTSKPTTVAGYGITDAPNEPVVSAPVTLSGSAVDITGIPSWATQIVININGASTNSSGTALLQLGDSGGVETTGYVEAYGLARTSSVGNESATTGFAVLPVYSTLDAVYGSIVLTLFDSATNTWVAAGTLGIRSTPAGMTMGGCKSLSAPLDRIRLQTAAGSWDAGTVNIRYS